MKQDIGQGALPRRSFLSRITAGAGALGAAIGGASIAGARPASPGGTRFQAARHPEDEWLEQTSAKHRFFYDTINADAFGQALFFARNYFVANASGYKLTDADVAQVICARHESAAFAFNDAMWAKYGAALSERAGGFIDPKTKQVPTINVYLAGEYGKSLKNVNVTLEAMTKRGVRLAVCGMATRAAANLIAQKTGVDADAVFKELSENLVPGGHLVPAGIVTLNRAQERGYTFAYVA